MQRYILVKEKLSPRHLSLLYREEVGDSLLEEWRKARESVRFSLLRPISAVLTVYGLRINLPYGLILANFSEFEVEPEALVVGDYTDEDFIRYILYDVPRLLDGSRRPVIVPELDERFSRNVIEGIVYSADILLRIGVAYRVPCIAVCSLHALNNIRYTEALLKLRHEGKVYIQRLSDNAFFEVRDYD